VYFPKRWTTATASGATVKNEENAPMRMKAASGAAMMKRGEMLNFGRTKVMVLPNGGGFMMVSGDLQSGVHPVGIGWKLGKYSGD
jgi:hypothetical protein